MGLHLEGPFISKVKKGIHREKFVIQPTDEMLAQIVPFAQYYPLKVTLAPEQFTSEQIRYLVNNGVIVSLGHSNASYEQAQQAFDSGASTVTHLFNAMSGLTGRDPGLIGACLSNQCYAGLIVDLLHVVKANVQLMSKLKKSKLYLVTDAVTPTGTDMTEFDLMGQQLYVIGGKCVDDKGVLGGAFLTMN